MPVIAYRHGVLAGCTHPAASATGTRASKMFRNRNLLGAVVGCPAVAMQFVSWVREGLAGDAPVGGTADNAYEGFVVLPDERLIIFSNGKATLSEIPYLAIGPGARSVMAELERGAGAADAIKVCVARPDRADPVVRLLKRPVSPPHRSPPHIALPASYSLYLDDRRTPPLNREWVVAKTYDDFVNTIWSMGVPDFVSFDHDLHPMHYLHLEHPIPYETYSVLTGYHAAQWLVEHCSLLGCCLPDWAVHTFNPTGRYNIECALSTGSETLAPFPIIPRNWRHY